MQHSNLECSDLDICLSFPLSFPLFLCACMSISLFFHAKKKENRTKIFELLIMLFLNAVILYTFTLNKGSHVKNTYRNLIYLVFIHLF